jgi:DNA-binding MarR family transcriptional regulator
MIGALLRMPVDAVHNRLLADLHSAGFTDLVPAHLAVLRWPGPQDQRPSDLARGAGMTKQAMNYLLSQLEQLGYLAREGDGEDQRSKRIRLTERGLAAAKTIRSTVRKIERELEREMGAAKFAKLQQLLTELNQTSLVRDQRE